MHEPSPDLPFDPNPREDSIFAEAGDLPTFITNIADGDTVNLEVIRELDPGQVTVDEAIKKRLGVTFWISSAWVGFITLLALLAPLLTNLGIISDPKKTFSGAARQAPSAAHWLGTDILGRDLLSRIIWGARVSLTVGVAAILLGLIIGGTVGLIAGFFKGRLEGVMMGAMDVLLAFPALLLALAIVTFSDGREIGPVKLGRTLITVVVAIGIVSIPPIARLVRAATLVFSQREFVTASRALGAGNTRIIAREILPNVVLPVLSFSIIGVAVAIVAEGGLAFLGLSVAPPTATWGGMINEGRSALETEPYIVLIPCFVLFLTVLSLNLAGDRLREYFDVKEGGL